VISFTHRPIYPQGKSPRHPLDRRLGGPQSRSQRDAEACKNKFACNFILYTKITILPVSYGCETRSVVLRGKHRSKMFENGVLRRIFGLKVKEVPGDLRKLHNEKLHFLPFTKYY
jgi:hypothetical protein